MVRLEILIELKFLNSSFSSLSNSSSLSSNSRQPYLSQQYPPPLLRVLDTSPGFGLATLTSASSTCADAFSVEVLDRAVVYARVRIPLELCPEGYRVSSGTSASVVMKRTSEYVCPCFNIGEATAA